MDAPVLRDKNTNSDDLCNDERLYFANDANMNVTALMGTDGTPLERYVYDPYGNCTVYDDDWSQTVSWANSKKNNIRYCGYYFDNETGLYHVRNRYYHPYFGLITRDPGGYVDGMSLYEYCRGSPVGFVDPTGQFIGPDDMISTWIGQALGGMQEKKCPDAGGEEPDEPPPQEQPPQEQLPPQEPMIWEPPWKPNDPTIVRRRDEDDSLLASIAKFLVALTFGNPGCKSCEDYSQVAKTAAKAEPFDVKDPRYTEAMKALRSREVMTTLISLKLQNAPAEIERMIDKGTISQSKEEGKVGFTTLGSTVINVSSTKNAGDIAMQLIGEWQWQPNTRGASHSYVPYTNDPRMNAHLSKIEAALNNFAKRVEDNQYKPKDWKHPTPGQ